LTRYYTAVVAVGVQPFVGAAPWAVRLGSWGEHSAPAAAVVADAVAELAETSAGVEHRPAEQGRLVVAAWKGPLRVMSAVRCWCWEAEGLPKDYSRAVRLATEEAVV
jgi:hypothetical protein